MFGAETLCPSRALTTTLVARYRDGGHQERDAATRFVKKVFPSAEVTATQTNERPITVRTGGEETVALTLTPTLTPTPTPTPTPTLW